MKDILLTKKAREHIQFFISTDRRLALKIFDFLEAIVKEPFTGIGKPEALKNDLKGYWSCRINDEHRIVYEITK